MRALNDDMAYDRFLLLQIAADQVEPAASPHLAATGFLTLGRSFLGVTHDIVDDRIEVVMRGTQALTAASSRHRATSENARIRQATPSCSTGSRGISWTKAGV